MQNIENELARLEPIARQLEPDSGQRARANQLVMDYANGFLQQLPGLKTFQPDSGANLLQGMPVSEQPYSMEQVLETLAGDVDFDGINPASGGHLGYIPGGGQYYAALGDYLADVFNRYAGVSYASPGAVQLEKSLIRWMGDLVGYPAGAAGDLTSGGSIANLMGVVAARDAAELKGNQLESSPIYLTEQVHHCVDKAIRIAGLGECPRRIIPMDAGYRMDAEVLAATIQKDKSAGYKPWLIVASAGTTDTGSVDPCTLLPTSPPFTASGFTWMPPMAVSSCSPIAPGMCSTGFNTVTRWSSTLTRDCSCPMARAPSWSKTARVCTRPITTMPTTCRTRKPMNRTSPPPTCHRN